MCGPNLFASLSPWRAVAVLSAATFKDGGTVGHGQQSPDPWRSDLGYSPTYRRCCRA
jgi:hypothetical protein